MSTAGRREVFIIGLDEFHASKLKKLSSADRCSFHKLLDHDRLADQQTYPVDELVDEALQELRSFPKQVDAIVGYMDFPVSTMVPILCQQLGLACPSLESVLRCEHKYWSRVEQRKALPDATPRFCLVDPFSTDAAPQLPYPFWLKPVKSWGSFLGFRIADQADFDRALADIRANIGRVAEPFNAVLRRAALPAEIASIDGHYCIAEELLSGLQCTLEGHVLDGRVGFHGVVDSPRHAEHSTFTRYEYPSRLPPRVSARMQDMARKVLEQIGLDRSGFNIEFLWDEACDRVGLLEINPRVAQHHGDLFEKVDGRSNLEVAVEVALGRTPSMPHRRGQFGCAAVFFWRTFEDAVVVRVPSPRRIREITQRFPSTVVHLLVRPGDRLSKLVEQDSYSYACAMTYVGARDHDELLDKYGATEKMLDFELASPEQAEVLEASTTT